MTLTDAIIKSLDEIGAPATYTTVYNHVVENNYYDFGNGKTPKDTVSSILVRFIQNGDLRIDRVKMKGGYHYYLAKNAPDMVATMSSKETTVQGTSNAEKLQSNYHERSLHMLLSSYLKRRRVYSKTIFHEQSKSGQDSNQTWTHPDMVGVQFLNLKSQASRDLLKSGNKFDLFKLNSYELKREINSDSELKKAYFQAVSNSSWANYGYLVAVEFNEDLREEMARLAQSFGIGIIKIGNDPYWTEILFPAKYRELDFQMIDKLCGISPDFAKFIDQTVKLTTAPDSYYSPLEKEFSEFCDKYLESEADIEEYCIAHKIPHIPAV